MSKFSVDEALRQAVSCHQSGRMQDAENLYRAVLDVLPDQPDANHNLGVLAMQAGRGRSGLPYLKAALQADPAKAQYWFSYIQGLIEVGEQAAARAMIAEGRRHGMDSPRMQALDAKLTALLKNPPAVPTPTKGVAPGRAELEQLGVLFTEGQYVELERLARRLTISFPEHAYAWKALGVALKMQERAGEALLPMRQALQCAPDDAEGHNNLATTLIETGSPEEAESSCRRALSIEPDYAQAHNNLGIVLNALGRCAESEEACRRALAINPDFPGAWVNLGNALKGLSRMREAEQAYRRALEINPQFFEAAGNLAGLLGSQGRIDAADEATCLALSLRPDDLTIRSNRLFGMNYRLSESPENRLAAAREFGALATLKAHPYNAWMHAPEPECLHVGLVSGDLRKHPVGYFLEGVLQHLDRRRIRLTAFSSYAVTDELTQRLRHNVDGWISLCGLDDALAAQRIHQQGCHLLLDLSGHTEFNRLPLFAWRPAPVQATWLGYFATTGVAEMDYFIADRLGAPASQQAAFTEKFWYLPDSRLCFTAPEAAPEPGVLPALHTGALTFASFQALAKINDAVLALWGQILTALPGARLRVYNEFFSDTALCETFVGRLHRCGLSPERVDLRGSLPRDAYLRAYAEIDVCLDTFPYPGGTTTCEALWMGVPTITLAGDTLLARQGVSLLGAAGLADWVAATPEAYVAKAIAVAGNLSELARLRGALRAQVSASPLFDHRRFARNLETALWEMWRAYRQQCLTKNCGEMAVIEQNAVIGYPAGHEENP